MSASGERGVEGRPAIRLEAVRKTYGEGDTAVHAVAHVDLTVPRGQYVAIMGASGSGKSTLMNIVGCLDAPSAGRYLLDGVDVRRLDESQLSTVRNKKIGFIFQSFNLIPRTSALSNVELPLIYAGIGGKERRERAMAALDKVGLSARRGHMPSELSGGQQQRVAVARAIVTDPVLLLADEPTGALDSKSTADVLDLFDDLASQGRTIMVITHEDEVGGRAQRLVVMRDGCVVSDTLNVHGERLSAHAPAHFDNPVLVLPHGASAHPEPAAAPAPTPMPVQTAGGGTHGTGQVVQQSRAAFGEGLF
ncbi:MAG TPA: ABC transporter ATP-binding protein [Sporichthyaceae bacterium]|jgi:putative ABC transport system ATP-binding protein|nr:ABC transporter ATP-binding protein [Sporichthyaceae bacterium]